MSEPVADTSTRAPASRADADAWLRNKARRVVGAHLTTREDADFARSVKSMIDKTVHEYDGRFVFELIQNGYDKQDRDRRDGRLAITLVHHELEHGVLYVANTGQGFTPSNVRAIANLGLSDKELGEGIGNKGVGFKSVLQICESPEVYSTLPDGSPGFCFRFARVEDIPALVDEDPVGAQQVLDEMSLYSITVPAEGTPNHVAALWQQGYSSVIRLPLSDGALGLVITRLQDLTRSDSPVLLFLPRLETVTVRHETATEHAEKVLSRRRERTLDLHADFQSEIVVLDGHHRYLAFSQEVPHQDVAAATRRAVEGHRLDPKWEDSTAPTKVSVAVPFDAPDAFTGRYYTYLPLGAKAPAPFAGHLNAPFSTNLARTDVDVSNPLNRLLLGATASLCLAAAEALTQWDERPAETVLDLICWDAEQLPILEEAADAHGLPLTKRMLVPSRHPGRWTSTEDVWRWPTPATAILTIAFVSATCGVDFLPDLAPQRSERFTAMLSALGFSADPPPEQLASWVETMLDKMLQEKRPISQWDRAYADIALIFARFPDALYSRRILLTDEWELRPCGAPGARPSDTLTPREALPFFPPARQRVDDEDDVDPDADLDLPKSLTRRLFYLNSGLTWHTNRQQTPARTFLQNNRLVRRFDTRGIFEHIRGLLAESRAQSVARDALRFAFNLHRGGASAKVNLAELGLRVLTIEGKWISARDAMFSAGWPDTTGDELSLIAGTSPDRSVELSELSARLIAAPSDLLGGKDDPVLWVEFLRQIGVRDLLPLSDVKDSRALYGRALTSRSLSELPNLPDAVRSQWAPSLPGRSAAGYPDTPYKAMSPVYWLPGQADWESLTHSVRGAMCRQILRGLKTWKDDAYLVSWDRDRSGDKNRQSLPTPLQVFLREAEWLPVQHPGATKDEYVRPSRCWTFPIRGDDTPPRYAALLSKRLRDLLDDDAVAIRRLRHHGLGVWGTPEDAPKLVRHLGDLVAENAIPDLYVSQFRNTYQRTWAECVKRPSPQPFPADSTSHLVVDVGGTTRALVIPPAGADEAAPDVVVAAVDDEHSLVRLLADFSRPILTVSSGADEVTALLRHRLGSDVSRATDVAPVVMLDGKQFEPADAASATTIAETIPALPVLVATLLEHRRGSFSHIGQRAFEEALDTLRRIRLLPVNAIEVRIGSDTRPLPPRSQGVLSVADRDYPALLVESSGELDWVKLDAIAEPLMYLIGRPEFATEFRLATTRMRAANVPLDGLEEEDVASACDVSVQDVRTTARRIESSITPLLERLYPVVVHYAGAGNATVFDPDTSSLASEREIAEALARVADRLPVAPGDLLRRTTDAGNVDGLRISLGLPLAALNATLFMLGDRYKPIDYSEQHAEEFADHVRRTRDRIFDRIRWTRWDRFTAFEPQADWTAVRRLDVLTPDSGWGLTLDVLTTELMEARIDAELERVLDVAPPTTGVPLESMTECSKNNSQTIKVSIGSLTVTVRAWLSVLGLPIESPWHDPDVAARALPEALDAAGALDFVELEPSTLLRWLQVLCSWPSDMPLTIDLDELGLSKEDIEAQRSEEAQRRADAVRARRTVYLDNQPFEIGGDLTEFAAALDRSLEATPRFLTSRNRFASLQEVSEGATRTKGSGGGATGGSSRQPRLSDAQRDAVGFAGEWLAYKWLDRLHGDDFSPECWASAYRELAFPGIGNDGLGWDFQVPTRQGLLMYEVKTSQGEGGQLELGETQVLAAQLNARNGRWRLLVITDVLNESRRIRMLRNPFDPRSRGQYVFVGQGLRLRYTPE